ncbi:hypothetical protein YC2023_026040 [Brassica napus]
MLETSEWKLHQTITAGNMCPEHSFNNGDASLSIRSDSPSNRSSDQCRERGSNMSVTMKMSKTFKNLLGKLRSQAENLTSFLRADIK